VVSRTLVIGLLAAVALVSLDAQWLTQPAPGIPRTKDGKPNLSAPAPRASDGKPALSGLWHVDPPPPGEIERLFGDHPEVALAVPGDDLRTFPPYFVNILADFKPGDVAVLPEAAARKYDSAPAVQTPQVVAILYEVDHTFRQIHTDGRKLPADPQPSWLGYSVGRWEGRTLVAETIGFNDRTPIDIAGNPRSESLRLTERFFRRDFGHLEVQFTIEDPKSYSKPFTIRITETLTPDTELLEYFCTENEKDRPHLNQ
jgi:hypothetical protein